MCILYTICEITFMVGSPWKFNLVLEKSLKSPGKTVAIFCTNPVTDFITHVLLCSTSYYCNTFFIIFYHDWPSCNKSLHEWFVTLIIGKEELYIQDWMGKVTEFIGNNPRLNVSYRSSMRNWMKRHVFLLMWQTVTMLKVKCSEGWDVYLTLLAIRVCKI